MIFPFRFAGDSHYMIIFDALIAFTYAFHVHAFIKQTRFTQNDIENCGIAQSVSFISFVHLAMISLILAIPKGGVLKATGRVFGEYLWQIVTDPSGWFHDVIRYF
jgi:ABC-type anion transport system duplicated permease subunit